MTKHIYNREKGQYELITDDPEVKSFLAILSTHIVDSSFRYVGSHSDEEKMTFAFQLVI